MCSTPLSSGTTSPGTASIRPRAASRPVALVATSSTSTGVAGWRGRRARGELAEPHALDVDPALGDVLRGRLRGRPHTGFRRRASARRRGTRRRHPARGRRCGSCYGKRAATGDHYRCALCRDLLDRRPRPGHRRARRGRSVPLVLGRPDRSLGRPGVGAVATQANAEISYGPRGARAAARGPDAGRRTRQLLAADPAAAGRQVAIIDAQRPRRGAHRRRTASPLPATSSASGVSCQANMMACERSGRRCSRPTRAPTDRSPSGCCGARRGRARGGRLRGRQSAALWSFPAKGSRGS